MEHVFGLGLKIGRFWVTQLLTHAFEGIAMGQWHARRPDCPSLLRTLSHRVEAHPWVPVPEGNIGKPTSTWLSKATRITDIQGCCC
jgi:hypothetical protein